MYVLDCLNLLNPSGCGNIYYYYYYYYYYVVAFLIGKGMQLPWQGIHEIHQGLPPFKSCSKCDFRDKFAAIYF
jgi:hypothetical protein